MLRTKIPFMQDHPSQVRRLHHLRGMAPAHRPRRRRVHNGMHRRGRLGTCERSLRASDDSGVGVHIGAWVLHVRGGAGLVCPEVDLAWVPGERLVGIRP